jgi:hypothetical protein
MGGKVTARDALEAAVASVGSKATGAFEACDVVEHHPDATPQMRGQARLSLGSRLVDMRRGFRDGHTADYAAAFSPADVAPVFPPNPNKGFPPNSVPAVTDKPKAKRPAVSSRAFQIFGSVTERD